MAIKILTTKSFMDNNVNTEASTRASEDSIIESDLSSKNSSVTTANLNVSSLNTLITNETNARTTFIGTAPDVSGLKLADDITAASTYSDAIAALYRKQVVIAGAAGGASGAELLAMKNNATANAATALAHKNSVDAILADAHTNFDTFVELYNLTQGNRTNAIDTIAMVKSSFLSDINTKVNRAQTHTSTLTYVDETTSLTYNLVVDNGALNIVEI